MYFVLEGHQEAFLVRCCLDATLSQRYPGWHASSGLYNALQLSTVLRLSSAYLLTEDIVDFQAHCAGLSNPI